MDDLHEIDALVYQNKAGDKTVIVYGAKLAKQPTPSDKPVEGCASKYCVTKAPYHNQAGWSCPIDDGCSCLAPLDKPLAQLIKEKLRDYAQLQDAVNRRGLM